MRWIGSSTGVFILAGFLALYIVEKGSAKEHIASGTFELGGELPVNTGHAVEVTRRFPDVDRVQAEIRNNFV